MTLLEGTVLFAAGLIAGACNAVAGGGVLFTFPAMMWAGLPPIAASVSSAVSMAGPRERDPSLWRGASPSSRPAKTLRRRQWAGGAVRQGRGACEGSSIRSVERVTGVTKRAVLNLMIAGKASRGLRKRTFARSRKPLAPTWTMRSSSRFTARLRTASRAATARQSASGASGTELRDRPTRSTSPPRLPSVRTLRCGCTCAGSPA